MSLTSSRRAPADVNAVDFNALPKHTLNLNFPSTKKAVRGAPYGLFLFVLFYFFFVGITPGALQPVLLIVPLTMLPFPYLLTKSKEKRKFIRRIFAVTVFCHVVYFAAVLDLPYGQELLGYAALFYAVYLGTCFQKHWQQRVCGGMLSKEVIETYKEKNHLPDGLKPEPTWPSFIKALAVWFDYDEKDTNIPGLIKSNAGPASSRRAMSVTALVLCAGYVAATATPLQLPVEPYELFVEPEAPLKTLAQITVLGLFGPVAMMYLLTSSKLGTGAALLKHQFDSTNYKDFVASLPEISNDENPVAKNSIYLGRVAEDGSPILVPKDGFLLGSIFCGPPGSGKTRFLCQLIQQWILQGGSVLSLDLKATSNEILYSCYEAAEHVRSTKGIEVPVYPFTNVTGRASYLLDVYAQKFWQGLTAEDKADLLLKFFALNFPDEYAKSYFRDSSYRVVQILNQQLPHVTSFQEAAIGIAESMEFADVSQLSRKVKEAGEHPRLMFEHLGGLDSINFRDTYSQQVIDSAVDFEQFFRRPIAMHCALPAATKSISSPQVGRIAISSLLAAATRVKEKNIPVLLVIDELQIMINRPAIATLLQQARSSNIAVVVSYQSPADLAACDRLMPDTVLANTNQQFWLKPTDTLARDQVQQLGGTYIDYLYSDSVTRGTNGDSVTETRREVVANRIESGLIDQVCASPSKMFMRVCGNAGYAAYGARAFVAEMTFHTTRESWKQLDKPWPKATAEMIINGAHTPQASGPPKSALLPERNKTSKNGSSWKPTELKP